jgi:WD40 repeat protein/tRNA A-37 threonylcarbamoyl transferase component Bud32
MPLSAAQLARMSLLLNEALPLDEAGRGRWLELLALENQDLVQALRSALLPESGEASGVQRFATLPKFESDGDCAAPASGLQPGSRVGPYQLIRLLGTGGMAEVWLAQRADGTFKREVALKLPLWAGMRRDLEQRFSREREILASLNHPNIAQLLDAGFAKDGQPYVALEYVAGTPFITHCDDHRLPLRARLDLFRQVLSAVQYAHNHLVIHRDLKPNNILVTEAGQVKLLDFGIAKLLSDGQAQETDLTRVTGRALTLDYAAPEQIAGEAITTAADVYALGVMLFELLTGQRPYRLKRDSRLGLEEAILHTDPMMPSRVTASEAVARARATAAKRLARELKGELDTIVFKALKKSPHERYKTADAFGEDIARYLRGDVVLAQRDSVAYRAVKFARRRWVALTVTGALILTLAAGLAATTYEARVASLQRDAALQAQLRSLTQTAAARLRDADIPGALSIILEVLPHRGAERVSTPEALNVFQEARAADALVLAITGHTDWVTSAAFSPDGRRIVSSSNDKTARLWDAATGHAILQLIGHTDKVYSAAFSPDGQRIVTASLDKTARIWDAATGQQLVLLLGHTDLVTAAEFSPDGRRIVTASRDTTARIWDAASGQENLILHGHTERVTSASFSPDGRRIATSAYDKTARIWDAASGREMLALRGHTDRVTFAAFSPDGGRVATASSDHTARLWDAATGQALMLLSGHTDQVWSIAFSPDGGRIATTSADKTARLWDAVTGHQESLLGGHTGLVASVAFSPDNRSVVTASWDTTVRLWNTAAGQEIKRLSGHTGAVASARYSADGNRIVTSADDKTARIWDAATGEQNVVLRGHTDIVATAAFSADGQRVVTASGDKSARIWDPATGLELNRLLGHTDQVWSAAFSPDGRRIVTASNDRTARVWDAATGREITVLSGHADRVTSAAFSPDGRYIVTPSYDKTARTWDAATGQQIMLLSGHRGALFSAAFSPDGLRIVTASNDYTARIWDSATGRQLTVLSGHSDNVETAAFSPDGRRIVTASNDHTARLWDSATGEQLALLSGHTDAVESAEFSPDGRHIVTASDDRTVRIWDARTAALRDQILWAEAAEVDPLPSTERFQLGLPAQTDIRQWPDDPSKCDEAAAAPYDPDRRAPGAMLAQIVADLAVAACNNDASRSSDSARSMYQRGRALMAGGNFPGAKQDFERALAGGYRSAQVDLGSLLSQSTRGLPDLGRAQSLYEHAWKDGVTVAAFALGELYEHGLTAADRPNEFLLAPEEARAWHWYQMAADRGQPNALARLAERSASMAYSQTERPKRNAYLLESFKYYAAAAEAARKEDWRDDAWRNWRYHRASLARLLAREGLMAEVAVVYEGVRGR